MATASLNTSTEWLSSQDAAALVGIQPHNVRRLAKRRLISVRAVPGTRPRYFLGDLLRIARDSVRPALAAPTNGETAL
jgi:hypothetical protein